MKKIKARKVTGFEKYVGFMFLSTTKAKPLLYEFEKDVNKAVVSMFVFFPFLVIFLDKDNNMIDSKVMIPGEDGYRPKIKYRKFIEIPLAILN